MSEMSAPEIVYGGLALAAVLLGAALHEFKAKNQRDARLLAAVGAAGLLGSAAALLV